MRKIAFAVFLCTLVSNVSATTETFSYTGAEQTWTVPAGITSATFDLYGAQGGTSVSSGFGVGGLGGRATATFSVTPGETIEIRVGGRGGTTGGYNGGGNPGAHSYTGGGGGATDVRQAGTALGDRVLVAGGGGGSGACSGAIGGPSSGGAGGGLVGGDALPTDSGASCAQPALTGKGGTQAAGGAGGTGASAGTLGQGGNAQLEANFFFRGGGGGGYYGGGGGSDHSGGGGGSGYGPGGTVFETGVRGDDGLATVVYDSRLDVTTSGSGSGVVTSNPAGIDCETGSAGHTDCSTLYADSSSVTLTANFGLHSDFTGWSGGGCSGTGDCTVTMDQARSITATFMLVGAVNAATAIPTLSEWGLILFSSLLGFCVLFTLLRRRA